jgi:hypothetical protein
MTVLHEAKHLVVGQSVGMAKALKGSLFAVLSKTRISRSTDKSEADASKTER